jgi:hypothetical protein
LHLSKQIGLIGRGIFVKQMGVLCTTLYLNIAMGSARPFLAQGLQLHAVVRCKCWSLIVRALIDNEIFIILVISHIQCHTKVHNPKASFEVVLLSSGFCCKLLMNFR